MILLLAVGCARDPVLPVLVYPWDRSPTVVVCSGSPLSVEDVEDVIDEWVDSTSDDYDFLYDYEVAESTCEDLETVEKITVDLLVDPPNPLTIGWTTSFPYVGREAIASAQIKIKDREDASEILLHELGHALGWGHSRQRDHVMQVFGGSQEDFEGLADYPDVFYPYVEY